MADIPFTAMLDAIAAELDADPSEIAAVIVGWILLSPDTVREALATTWPADRIDPAMQACDAVADKWADDQRG